MDWQQLMQMMGIGGGLGTAAGGAYNLFGKGQPNPADAANKTIGQIPGQTQQYYDPYMQAGKGAMGDLQNRYKDLLGGNVQNQLGENYKQSPGYQFKLQQGLAAGNNAAAMGGALGTPMHQQQSMQLGNDIASQDYNDYLKNQMGLYGLGLGGEEGVNKMGFEANKGMADTVGNALSQQGAYQFAGQAGKNAANAQNSGNLFSGLGMAASSAMPWFLKMFGG